MKRMIDSQRAWVERVTYYELMNAPDYTLAYEHYYPGQAEDSDASLGRRRDRRRAARAAAPDIAAREEPAR